MKDFTSIEKLRENWKKQTRDQLKVKLTLKEIESITRKKSQNEINRLKRKFLIENSISFVLIIAILLFANFKFDEKSAVHFDIFVFVILTMYIIPLLGLFNIKKLSETTTSSFLNSTVPILKRIYIQFKWIAIFIMPLCCSALACISRYSVSENPDHTAFFKTPIFIGSVVYVVTLLFMYLCFRFVYDPIYLKHIKNLDELKNDINKAEEHEDIMDE
ncbi:hypothetical protein [Saccharicrinis aurantiacus]|uniref:hypothetical protein n=1 Tax=Saccharicrinis aurantiacus TaxID=1849719 RepID=UPI00094F7816|nr:hypothetical protein [Saccharicrinis aurantiacus]